VKWVRFLFVGGLALGIIGATPAYVGERVGYTSYCESAMSAYSYAMSGELAGLHCYKTTLPRRGILRAREIEPFVDFRGDWVEIWRTVPMPMFTVGAGVQPLVEPEVYTIQFVVGRDA
tara:strand:- start:98 stop:451 length:354 start_codon:yes stop_codon:yes gene_type:complete